MVDPMPHGSTADAHFSFTKLVVHDLDKEAAFYSSVCGLVEQMRYESTVNDQPISEIIFSPTYPGGGSLTLLKFNQLTGPSPGESILGFATDNLEAFLARTEAAGGRVTQAIKEMPEIHLRVAFVVDPEGHLIEVVQLDK